MSDLINRQDAINALTEANIKSHMDSVEGGQENRSAIRIIMELPSVERKHGHWIKNDNGTYSCSVCQSWIPNEQHYYANYCLHCGADMRGEENDKE